jgi:hypothetical protein
MAFLNRQEIAFLFVCAAILSITNADWSLRRRRLVFFGASLGVELSHYSTMYFFLGILVIGWSAQLIGRMNFRLWRRVHKGESARRPTWGIMVRTVGIGSIFVVAAIAFTWGQLATQTAGSAFTDASSAVSGLIGSGSSTRSTDVSYGLVPGATAGPQTVLNDYRHESLKVNAHSASGTYVPAALAARYATPVVASLPSLPLTRAGRLLASLGVPVAALNGIIRIAAAKGEQLFAGLGLITFIVARRLKQHVGREMFYLCIGGIAMVAVLTVLPNLSVDYGVLRAFQEALILIAPVLVAGSITVFSPLRDIWALRLAAAVCLGIFISTTGLLPQLLGGYPAQLTVNNSGSYYDDYYMHPQEVAAVSWLGSQPEVISDGVQASFDPNRYAFTAESDVNGVQNVMDIYPPLVRRASWVIVGYWTMHTGRATASYDGDLVDYIYPLNFLKTSKDLVFNNGGSEIYK